MDAPAANASLELIQEGDYVVFDEHGDKKSLVQIKRNGRAKVGKSHINTGDLIGAQWGSVYTLSAGSRHLAAVTEHEPVSGPAVDEVEKDNRDLVDVNTSQTLTAEQIEAMKASGKGGDAIIEALCKGSTTFEAKTEFAQEKYKRRKARKYLTRLTLRQPTGWTVCQVLFDKTPNGVWNLRPDSLALLLSIANVGAGSRCLVLENCQGLVSGAVAERLGGVGALCCLGTGSKPAPLTVLNQMNLAPQHKAIISAAQLADLLTAAQQRSEQQKAAAEQQQQQPAALVEADQQQSKQQQEQQATANGSDPQQQPQQQAAGATCAAEAAAGQAAAGLVSSSIPVVAAAVTAAAAPAAAPAPATPAEPVPAAAAAAAGDDADDLDALYDSSIAAAAAAAPAAGEQGSDNKRKRSAAALSGNQQADDAGGQQKRQKQQQQGDAANPADTEMVDADTAAARSGPKDYNRDGRVQHLHNAEAVEQLLASGGFNSLIIAAPKLQPASMLQQLLPLLEPSSPFVVFSPWVQPLAEAMAALQASRSAVLLQLQESWLRPYQVLPGRTHPHMALSTGGTGGYILSGITVVPDNRPEGAKDQQQQRKGAGRGRGGRGGKGRGNTMRR